MADQIHNLIMKKDGVEIPFTLLDDEMEAVFNYLKVTFGCYEGISFEQAFKDAKNEQIKEKN